MAIATINPATGETLQTFEPLTDEAVEEKVARAAAARPTFSSAASSVSCSKVCTLSPMAAIIVAMSM